MAKPGISVVAAPTLFGSLGMVLALATPLQLVAGCLDSNHLRSRGKPEPLGDAVFEGVDVLVFELDDLLTIHTNEMIVMGVADKIWIVMLLVLAEIDLLEQSAFHQERKGSINRGARHRRLNVPGLHQQLFGRIMLRGAEGCLDDRFTLDCLTQSAFFDEMIDFLAEFSVHKGGVFKILPPTDASQPIIEKDAKTPA